MARRGRDLIDALPGRPRGLKAELHCPAVQRQSVASSVQPAAREAYLAASAATQLGCCGGSMRGGWRSAELKVRPEPFSSLRGA